MNFRIKKPAGSNRYNEFEKEKPPLSPDYRENVKLTVANNNNNISATPLRRQDVKQGQFFKRNLAGFNSLLSFSLPYHG